MEGNNLSCAKSEDIYMDNDTMMDTGMDLNPPRLEEPAV